MGRGNTLSRAVAPGGRVLAGNPTALNFLLHFSLGHEVVVHAILLPLGMAGTLCVCRQVMSYACVKARMHTRTVLTRGCKKEPCGGGARCVTR
jgi:hypothetical protein